MASLKGDMKVFFAIFIGSLIAIVFLASISDSIFTQTNTFDRFNETVTAPAVNGTLDLTGRELVGTGIAKNATNITGSDLTNLGVFVQSGTGSNGLLTVQLTLNDTGVAFAAKSINVSYEYNPDGYLSNSGARSIATVSLIIFALAILMFVIMRFMKEGSMRDIVGIGNK